jgi:hypothetical protein
MPSRVQSLAESLNAEVHAGVGRVRNVVVGTVVAGNS